MKVVFERAILCQFIVASLLFGGFIVGPVSVRIYSTLIIFSYLLFNGYKFKINKPILLYALFICFYFLALVINGELGKVDFLKYFFGRYFVCFVAFFAVYSLTKTRREVQIILLLFVVVGVLNALVTLLQYGGSSFAVSIPLLFNPMAVEDKFEQAFELLDSGVDVGTFGLFGSIVENGYKASLFAVIIPIFYFGSKSKLTRIVWLGGIVFLGLAVFLTQQRLVTILVAFFYLYILYKSSKVFFPALLGLFCVALFVVIQKYGVDSGDFGRLANLQDENRLDIFNLAFVFISEHLFAGGQMKFGDILIRSGAGVFSSHNVFLNAFIYSGLFGGVVLVFLYFKMVFRSLRFVFLQELNLNMFIAAALAIQLLNSLTHNSSLVTGDETLWILYALLMRSCHISKIS